MRHKALSGFDVGEVPLPLGEVKKKYSLNINGFGASETKCHQYMNLF